ncbi:putative XRE family transcriptional regulator [Bacillus phage Bp8p-C]|uniref:Putative XRE family transcriptional regulator n=2 Tax=Agatevirus Bp8pC TaxID=1910937 RepID=A0A0A0PLD7_9CAUD|nr:putative XRE family transcriptional regulator [Bacillus phage Bp8p-C]YP_009784317.1 putative XRE family transcriptional regulator [Bacillus phage Bp8p-T]AHJ87447.1 putative XRE family transcriptional regulator [Bacillus phage Bp8p-C]AHJ87658.1 putative XRE family transcriptional regulator [Bacillus phage Bp8p-T]
MKRTYIFRLKIKDVLEERGMDQKELANLTGLRAAAISEMANNRRTVLNKAHLSKIMDALNITRLEDILELVIEDEF